VYVLPTEAKSKSSKFSGGQALQAIQQQIANGDQVMLNNYGPFIRSVSSKVNVGVALQGRTIAQAILARGRRAFLQGRGKTIGLETLEPRQVIELRNLGNRFSGKYYVTSLKHVFSDSRFVTTFVVRLLSEIGVV